MTPNKQEAVGKCKVDSRRQRTRASPRNEEAAVRTVFFDNRTVPFAAEERLDFVAYLKLGARAICVYVQISGFSHMYTEKLKSPDTHKHTKITLEHWGKESICACVHICVYHLLREPRALELAGSRVLGTPLEFASCVRLLMQFFLSHHANTEEETVIGFKT